jgi:hypothetical protein
MVPRAASSRPEQNAFCGWGCMSPAVFTLRATGKIQIDTGPKGHVSQLQVRLTANIGSAGGMLS